MEVAAETNILPSGFADLLQFREWGELETQADRYLKRQTTALDALQEFYDAITPRLPAIFALLDSRAPGSLAGPEERLLRMTLGLAEVAQAVETFHQSTVPHMRSPHRVDMRTIGPNGAIL